MLYASRFLAYELQMLAFSFCILLEIMEQGKWFRCSQPWLFGIFESQKQCLLNIRVRSKFSYLEYSVLLLEMRINWSEPFCLWAIIQHEAKDSLLHSPGNRLSWRPHLCYELYVPFMKYLWRFKNCLRRESFLFQRRAEIKRSILARTRFKYAFFSQNPTHSPTVW